MDRLRDRILLGRYFGRWRPGDRLPSVRDVSRLEEVDRKTAAAAYRRLAQEGLVRVEPRSGVYLRDDDGPDLADPLQRLHRQWLEQALGSAEELGLDAPAVSRMLQGVAQVKERRIPVVDEDPEHAALVAREISTRMGLDCVPCRPHDIPARTGPLKDAPFVIATPTAAAHLRAAQRQRPLVHATLAGELLDQLQQMARKRPVTVIVGTEGLLRELRRAIEHGLAGPADRIRVVRIRSRHEAEALADTTDTLLAWPGAPDWIGEHLAVQPLQRGRLLSEVTVREVRHQVARAALEAISRSSVS